MDFSELYHVCLHEEASLLPSLTFFHPQFMSLTKPHPIYSTCGTNPFEANKAKCMATFLSGRFISDYMSRHWDPSNTQGICKLCLLSPGHTIHILTLFISLQAVRSKLVSYWFARTSDNHLLSLLLWQKLSSEPTRLTNFLVDPSTDPDVISATQTNICTMEEIFSLCRTWCYAVKRRWLKLLDK